MASSKAILRKKEQLGTGISNASYKLRGMILFSLVEELNRNYCYRCGEVITIEEFSIEHKINWLDSENPKQLYYDLKNIAFSHFKCNAGNTRDRKYATQEERNRAKLDRWKAKKKSPEYKAKRNKALREGKNW